MHLSPISGYTPFIAADRVSSWMVPAFSLSQVFPNRGDLQVWQIEKANQFSFF
ncbi:MAG: hypothetical protein KBG16_06575 [Methanospirillum sp.]|jgi:hypothetical protein|uniref:hypothetical protein n=1 Tax=Methanospirillum hungatei TaxID=2203 RepID=UPI0003245CB7|nr:hypothetical protein [Methanospirillum hungatei]MBP9008317.1 hypothetical protein [Methanospirillum sp.]